MYRIAFLLLVFGMACSPRQPEFTISVQLPGNEDSVYQGRVLLLLSNNEEREPRFQINDGPGTQLVFGLNAEGVRGGESVTFTAEHLGYPIESLKDIKAGTYYVQALLNRYETFNLSTGHTVQLPPDRGEGQQWNRKPGNLYSTPVALNLDPATGLSESITLDRVIDPSLPLKTPNGSNIFV